MVVKSEAACIDCQSSSVDASLSATCIDSKSSLELSSIPVTEALDDSRTSTLESSIADHMVDTLPMSSAGLTPTFVAATPKVVDSTSGPIKLVIAANSIRPKVSASTQANLPASEVGHPTLLVGPAVTSPICMTSPRRTVTVLPAGIRSTTQGALNARPLTAAGQTVSFAARSPGKVTVLSLPKMSTVPGQFVTVVPNNSSAAAVSNNKATALPYKVLIRPPSAVSILFKLL